MDLGHLTNARVIRKEHRKKLSHCNVCDVAGEDSSKKKKCKFSNNMRISLSLNCEPEPDMEGSPPHNLQGRSLNYHYNQTLALALM